MKTIEQSATITYSIADFKDAIVMLSLMDYLVERINNSIKYEYFESLPEEKKKEYYYPSCGSRNPERKQYDLLRKFGFESSIDILEGDAIEKALRRKKD